MKKFLITSILIGSQILLSAQAIYFSDPIPVADNSYGSKAPRIELLEDGSPVVYVGKSGTQPQLNVVRGDVGVFLDPVTIPLNGLDVNLWSGELGPQMATFGNSVFVIYEVYGDGIYLSVSADGGSNWADPVSVVDLDPGRYATLPGVGVDLLGNPIVNFVTTNSQEQDALFEVVYSQDGGQTFEPALVANTAAAGGEVCECCTAGISTDSDGQVFLSFRNNNNNIRDIWVTRLTDWGTGFDIATDIDDTDWQTFTCPSSGPMSVESGADLISVFFSAGGSSSSVYVSSLDRSTMEAGSQWEMPTFTGDAVTQNYPRIAGRMDTLGMVWEENATGSKDVMFAYSTTGASTLTAESLILAGGAFAQKNPDIAYGNGIFHIVYTDQVTNEVMYVNAGFAPFVSVKELALPFEVLLTPNPAKDFFQINLSVRPSEKIVYTLFHASGQVALSGEVAGKSELVVRESLPAGVYFLEVSSGESRITKRIILH